MYTIQIEKLAHFSGHKGAIFSLETSVNKNCFYSGGDEGYVVEWNYETKADGKLIVQVQRPVYSLKLDTERQLLFCGSASGNLHVVDLKTMKEIRNIEAHSNGLYDIKIYNENIFTSGGDGRVCVWDIETLKLQNAKQWTDKSARVLSFHPTLDEIAIGYSDHKIRIATTQLELLKTIDAHNNSVFALAYAPKGDFLLSGGRDVMLRSWNRILGFEMELDIPAHTLHINSIVFSPDSTFFLTVSMDKTIKVWETETIQLLKVIDKVRNDAHINSINKAIWVNNNTFVTCSDDRQIMMFKLNVQTE